MTFLTALLPVALAITGLVPLIGVVAIWRERERRYSRASPLTRDLLRPPGHSLRKRLDDLTEELDLHLLAVVSVPLLVFAIHVSQSYFSGAQESTLRIGTSVGLGVAVTIFAAWRMLSLIQRRKFLKLGLEGELATGEELNQLMLDGCRVFHDIPFPYGNIDHVVVSQSGIFSVNSKMLGKPKGSNGSAEITVDQGRSLVRFPDREYRIPVEQFETEANWLAKHLSSAVAQPLKVEPILALPGWFVKERVGKGPVYVINPHRPKKFFVQNRQVLSPELVQQVAHQLEHLCRDVEPSFREKRPRWEA